MEDKIDVFFKAFNTALRAHQGQLDKSGVPYILHPLAVSCRCESFDERIVALLHDVVEDSDVTLKDLFSEFPSYIVQAVDAITHRKNESHRDYVIRCSKNIIAARVKIQDVKHNMERMGFLTDQNLIDRLVKKYTEALEILKVV